MSVTQVKYDFHKEVTKQMREGKLSQEQRVRKLKAFGITALENIELDCQFKDDERKPYAEIKAEAEWDEQFNDWQRDRG